MIKFLIKGLLRDVSRSKLPVMVVAIGVMLSVFMHAYITGFMGDSIEMNAKFSSGHVKVVTKAYAENQSQMPNDLAILGVDDLKKKLQTKYPNVSWVERINFGGLIDVPDQNGETKAQGPAIGMAIDFLSGKSDEIQRLKIESSLIKGRLPEAPIEVLISDQFARKLGVELGQEITFMGSTMYGAMTYYNYTIVGTVSFGSNVLDKGTIMTDLEGARLALDMDDAAGEILGFFNSGFYDDELAKQYKSTFETSFSADDQDEFAPTMLALRDQNMMSMFVDLAQALGAMITSIFILAMALVLWNAGLLGGLRRYGEFGVRLAMGETKSHVYRSLLIESIGIGIVGSIVGTALGLGFSWLLETYGLNIGDKMQASSIMMPTILRTRITPVDYYIGFLPGIFSTLIGAALAGIGIYKRKTSQLFKELET